MDIEPRLHSSFEMEKRCPAEWRLPDTVGDAQA